MASFPPRATDFVEINNVPVFYECAFEDESGRPMQLQSHDIDEIVRLNNEQIAAGEMPVIHVGHNDGKSEKPVYGYLSQFAAGVREGLRTIFAKVLVYPERESELRSYPRRSIEIYKRDGAHAKRWIIPSMALLGSNDPALKLGVMYGAKDRECLAMFAMQNTEKTSMLSEEMKAELLEFFSQTDVFKYCHEQMGNAESAESEDPAMSAEDATGDGSQGVEGEAGDPEEKTTEEQGDAARKSEGSAAEEEKEDEKDGNKSKFSTLQAEVSSLRKQLRTADRAKQFAALEGEGFIFNAAEELADTDELSDAMFAKHVVRIKRSAQKAPVGLKFSVASVGAGGNTSSTIDQSRINRAQMYARQNPGTTFQQALEATK